MVKSLLLTTLMKSHRINIFITFCGRCCFYTPDSRAEKSSAESVNGTRSCMCILREVTFADSKTLNPSFATRTYRARRAYRVQTTYRKSHRDLYRCIVPEALCYYTPDKLVSILLKIFALILSRISALNGSTLSFTAPKMRCASLGVMQS